MGSRWCCARRKAPHAEPAARWVRAPPPGPAATFPLPSTHSPAVPFTAAAAHISCPLTPCHISSVLHMQGDVLSGCIAAYSAWAQRAAGASREQLHGGGGGGDGGAAGQVPPLVAAAYAGCLTTRCDLPALASRPEAYNEACACVCCKARSWQASSPPSPSLAPYPGPCFHIAGGPRSEPLRGSGAPWEPQTCWRSWVRWLTSWQWGAELADEPAMPMHVRCALAAVKDPPRLSACQCYV